MKYSSQESAIVNLKWGLKGGIAVALVYCAWVTVVYAVNGGGPFERHGVDYRGTVLLYLGAGIVSGAIVGLLRPLIRNNIGAYLVGVIGALPIGAGTAMLVTGLPRYWGFDDWILVPLISIGAGIALGSELRKTNQRSD